MLKKRISDIQTSGIVHVPPSATAFEAVVLMRKKGISCILVLEGDQLLGIVTERNVVRAVLKNGSDLSAVSVPEIMTTPVLTGTEDMYVYEAFSLLIANSIRHLPILDWRSKIVGIVTQSNLMRFIDEEYFVEYKSVAQIMSTAICTVTPTEIVRNVLRLLVERRISCVIVEQDQKPVGIITERDIARVAAQNLEVIDSPVSVIMSSPVQTVGLDMVVYQAASLMRDANVRRLVAVDKEGRIAGLTTQTDIIRGLEARYVEVLREIIQEKEHELKGTLKDLYEKTAYFDNILYSAIDMGIVATDKDLRITYYNPVAESTFGTKAKDAIGQDLRSLPHLKEQEVFHLNGVMATVLHKRPFQFALSLPGSTGDVRHIQAKFSGIWDKRNQLLGYVLVLNDITDRRNAEDTIRFMAYHDILTGLPNRMLFNERLSLELAHAERTPQTTALMLVDVDHFKDVNDTLGHHAGDALLKAVANRLRDLLRKSDTVARIGGDEFILIMSRLAGAEDAIRLADKVREVLEQPYRIENRDLPVTVSIGVALSPEHGQEAEDLIKIADKAMYKAKDMNRENNRSNIYFWPIS